MATVDSQRVKPFLLMKAYQHTITHYFGGSVKQVNLYETLKIPNVDVVGRLTL